MTFSLRSSAVPLVLMGVMFALMITSSRSDSAIFDETAHIGAGYAYLTEQDYRLNPEHPPLVKDLAAFGLLLAGGANFPTDTAAWRDQVNGQWDQGRRFFYEAGNNPDTILRAMRLPLILLTILLGWLFWRFIRENFGGRVAGVCLFLYAFSPTFLAHGRYVTTDVVAAFGFFVGIATFLRFLRVPSWQNILLAGLAFGVAQSLKFSLLLLIPTYALMLVAWALSRLEMPPASRVKAFLTRAGKTVLIGFVGLAVIWAVFAFHVWNYPADRNLADAQSIIGGYRVPSLARLDFAMIRAPLLRPLGQYLFGVLMVAQRTAGGNTQYFLGEITSEGSRLYFPLLYLLKEPLAFHILTLIAVAFAVTRVARAERKSLDAALAWIRDHFIEASAIIFIAVYWASSIASPLNIGVRHVLPTFPFIFLLVARQIVAWLRSWPTSDVVSWWDWLRRIYEIYIASLPRYLIVAVLILWQASSVLGTFPSFLSYFNALAVPVARAVSNAAVAGDLPRVAPGGGTANGYLIATDSNYDWGQDLKRLQDWVDEKNEFCARARTSGPCETGVPRIYVDYFGGGSPGHELGGRFEPWWPARGYPPGGGWLAVSANALMGAYGAVGPGFERKPEDSYGWLTSFAPMARAGTSIFIFRLPPENPQRR